MPEKCQNATLQKVHRSEVRYVVLRRKKEKLFRTLSPSLTLSVPTTNQVKIIDVTENITNELLKVENRPVGLHELLRNAIIHLTYADFLQLKSSTDNIQTFLNFIGNHVKRPIEAAD